jgi:hypothetical protein
MPLDAGTSSLGELYERRYQAISFFAASMGAWRRKCRTVGA